jgi:hypothetical protein
MHDAFVQRYAGAEGKDQDRNDKAPEVKLAAVTQGMVVIGRPRGAVLSIQKQHLIGGVDDRMDALAEHGRTAGPCRGDQLGGRNGEIACQGGIDHRSRFS